MTRSNNSDDDDDDDDDDNDDTDDECIMKVVFNQKILAWNGNSI